MPQAVPNYKPPRMKWIPAVRSADYYRSAEWFAMRQAVLLRDEYTCRVCGKVITSMPQVDHIVPRRDGGADTMDNLQTLCPRHHSQKTTREIARRR